MKGWPSRSVVIAVCLISAAAIVGCGGSDSAQHDDSVSVAMNSDVVSLDPVEGQTQPDTLLTRAMYDTLVRLDVEGEIVGELAESWDQKPASATVTLRDGITCSDGTPLDAKAVAASLNRARVPLAPEVGGATMKTTVGPGSRDVTVTLDRPFSALLEALGTPAASIVCPAGIEDPDSLAEESAGTGPYVLDDVARGNQYTLTKRTDYDWAPDLGPEPEGKEPTTLTFRVVENESTLANLLQTGELDAGILSGPDVERMQELDTVEVEAVDAGASFVLFNEKAGSPFSGDEDARRAAGQAIDREAFLRSIDNGIGSLTDSFVAPSTPCYDDSLGEVIPAYDQAAASAGLEGVDEPLRILATGFGGLGPGNVYVQEALRSAGVDATLQQSDLATYADRIFDPAWDWDISVVLVQASMVSSAALLIGPPPPDGSNLGSIDNPTWDAAYEQATTSLGEARCAGWEDGQRALVENVDLLPLATYALGVVWADGVSGLAPQGNIDAGSIRVN